MDAVRLAQTLAEYVAPVPRGSQFVSVDSRADTLRNPKQLTQLAEVLCAVATQRTPEQNSTLLQQTVCQAMAWAIIPEADRVRLRQATWGAPRVGSLVEWQHDATPQLWVVQSVSGTQAQCLALGSGKVSTMYGCDLRVVHSMHDTTTQHEADEQTRMRQPRADVILRAGGMLWTPFDHAQITETAYNVCDAAANTIVRILNEERARHNHRLVNAWLSSTVAPNNSESVLDTTTK